MKFLIGSQNFGFELPNSDKDYIEYYPPTVGELCRQIPNPEEG